MLSQDWRRSFRDRPRRPVRLHALPPGESPGQGSEHLHRLARGARQSSLPNLPHRSPLCAYGGSLAHSKWEMPELLTESRFCPCADPLPFHEKRPTVTGKGTISIRKTNSLDYTYLGYRLRADQTVVPISKAACKQTSLACQRAETNRSIQAKSMAGDVRPDVGVVRPLRVGSPFPNMQH